MLTLVFLCILAHYQLAWETDSSSYAHPTVVCCHYSIPTISWAHFTTQHNDGEHLSQPEDKNAVFFQDLYTDLQFME